MKGVIFTVAAVLGLVGLLAGCAPEKAEHEHEVGMEQSVKVEQPAQGEAGKEEAAPPVQEVIYTCPMHPEVISDKPGKCPKCGMNLESKK